MGSEGQLVLIGNDETPKSQMREVTNFKLINLGPSHVVLVGYGFADIPGQDAKAVMMPAIGRIAPGGEHDLVAGVIYQAARDWAEKYMQGGTPATLKFAPGMDRQFIVFALSDRGPLELRVHVQIDRGPGGEGYVFNLVK